MPAKINTDQSKIVYPISEKRTAEISSANDFDNRVGGIFDRFKKKKKRLFPELPNEGIFG
jgi:hypothetical protein